MRNACQSRSAVSGSTQSSASCSRIAPATRSRRRFNSTASVFGGISSEVLGGVDLNPESIEITKLSLWLKTARYGKPLQSLEANLRVGNSLIADLAWTPQ